MYTVDKILALPWPLIPRAAATAEETSTTK